MLCAPQAAGAGTSVSQKLAAAKAGQVAQVYRYPGLSPSTISTLLRKVSVRRLGAIRPARMHALHACRRTV